MLNKEQTICLFPVRLNIKTVLQYEETQHSVFSVSVSIPVAPLPVNNLYCALDY